MIARRTDEVSQGGRLFLLVDSLDGIALATATAIAFFKIIQLWLTDLLPGTEARKEFLNE